MEFAFQYIESAIGLGRVKDMPSDWAGEKVRDLESRDIGSLGDEARLEVQCQVPAVRARADSSELEFQLVVLPLAPTLDEDRGPCGGRFAMKEPLVDALESGSQRDLVRVLG